MVAPLFQDHVGAGEFAPDRAAFPLDLVAVDSGVALTLTDYSAERAPMPDDLRRLAAPLSQVLTDELDGASRHLGVPAEEILLAALGRTVQRTAGSGVLALDLTVCDAATVHGVAVPCVGPAEVDATALLADVRAAIAGDAVAGAEVAFSYTASGRAAEVIPGLGHALELRAYREAGVVALDWWYDTRRFEDYTVEELTEQFALALIEVTSEAVPTALEVA
ncbi:hypothetical protein [Mycolicibacterium canariasense]|nr:hypothetical protein [Mycolicibacterium canariasense]ORU99945.1 hypothetical protein AWB94_27885 [Mycolicibacterium canariasense]